MLSLTAILLTAITSVGAHTSLGARAIADSAQPRTPVTVCQLDSRGQTRACVRSVVRGRRGYSGNVHGRVLIRWNGRCLLSRVTVNGRPGRWNRSHDAVVWQGGRIYFNGVDVANQTGRTVYVRATC